MSFTCEAIAKAATPDDIEALADKLEPALAKAIRDVLREHVARVPLDDLAEAIKAGESWRVLDIIGGLDAVKAANVKAALENTVWAGGALAAQGLDLIEARFAFNRLNPELIRWLETYSLNLIAEIDRGTREAVRAALIDGMRGGRNPIDQARQIKQAVGLTERQSRAVASYRKALETFHLKRSAKSWGLGAERSRLSGVEVMPRDSKGKPTDGIGQRRLRDMRYDGSLQRAMDEKKPLKPEQIDKQVERYQERAIQNRARTIARTEALRALNVGVYEAWRQAIATGKVEGARTYKIWRVSRDERSCLICRAIPGANPKIGVPIEAYFKSPHGLPLKLPPAHPSCFPAGTLVSASSRITGASRRWYDGEMIVVGTASGHLLTGTPNHPVLTEKGWVALGALNESDSLIRSAGRQFVRVADDEEHGPALIEDVASAAFKSGAMATAEVPLAAEHFHGDASDGDVAIVATDRRLRPHRKAASLKHLDHAVLKNALGFFAAQLASVGRLAALVFGGYAPAGCHVCGGDLGRALSRSHPRPFERFGLALPARRQAVVAKERVDSAAANAALARELIDGCALEVARDKILSVRRVPFRGHVFNLETVAGHYNANGFVVHNCRCSVFLRVYEPQQLQDAA